MGHGALILGHSHPAIVQAVQEQMAKGVIAELSCSIAGLVYNLIYHLFNLQPKEIRN
ncbi:MAG: hypothetical protein KAW83_04750 [Dehalococcoidia bacterium]|nr:hypothetical protein [Dehalococcoidia bacterium]